MSRRLNPGAPEFSPSSAILSLLPCVTSSIHYFPPPSSPPFLYSNYSFYQLPSTPLYYHLPTFSPPLPPIEKIHRRSTGHNFPAKKLPRGNRLKGKPEKKHPGFFRKDENIRKVIIRHEIVPLAREEDQTTVMIKNIPYDCARKGLISMLDSFCSTENSKKPDLGIICGYDFVYLPIDFRTRKSRGFAFVNFTNTLSVWKFFEALHLKECSFLLPGRDKWCKKIEIVSAKVQGKEALVKHFSESIFECESDEFLPVTFTPARDGTGKETAVMVVGNRRIKKVFSCY